MAGSSYVGLDNFSTTYINVVQAGISSNNNPHGQVHFINKHRYFDNLSPIHTPDIELPLFLEHSPLRCPVGGVQLTRDIFPQYDGDDSGDHDP